jgi:predicted Fe-Mo cluster-binding NifX family protein
MKIAIPTDDGIMLSASVKNPKGYLIFTIKGGEILNEELRWNKLSDVLTPEFGELHNLMDCSRIIVNFASEKIQQFFISNQIEVILTKEVIITRAIMEFLNKTLLRESNTSCSP